MRTGKDTFAQILKEELEKQNKSVLITHFADEVKFVCKNFFSWNGEKDEEGRKLLQYVGTDYFRNQVDQDYWVNRMVENIKAIQNYPFIHYDYIIISDTRFPNEIEKFKTDYKDISCGFPYQLTTIRMVRELSLTSETTTHSSETALDGYRFDYIIINNDSIEDLYEKAKTMLSANKLYGGMGECYVI